MRVNFLMESTVRATLPEPFTSWQHALLNICCAFPPELGGNSHRRRGFTATRSALNDIGMHDSRVNGRKVKAKGQAKRTKIKGKHDAPSKQDASKAATSLQQNKKRTANKSKQKERENEASSRTVAAERWLPLDDKHDCCTF